MAIRASSSGKRAVSASLPSVAERFETVDHAAGGATYRVFRNAPRNLRDFYREAVARHAEAVFLVYQEERYALGEGWAIAERVAAGLSRLGVKPGDRVAIAMRNYPEWAWAFLAATSIGAVAVCLNSWWSGAELEFGIRDSGARIAFVDQERLDRIRDQAEALGLALVAVRCEPDGAAMRWADVIAGGPPFENEWPAIGFEDPATLLYTSGSTSRPKGVLSSHRAIVHAVMGYEFGAALLEEKQRGQTEPSYPPALLVTAPLFHVTGLNSQFLLSLRLGRKIVAMRKWDAEEALDLIERERVTQFSGVPTMVSELMNAPGYAKHDVSSLQAITGGGASMTPSHSRRVADRTGGRISARTGYAMTETNGLAASHGGKSFLQRPGSVGKAQPPLVSIAVADPSGAGCPPGVEGEVLIHGAMNFSCYWNDPEATVRGIRAGWVHTGDLGYLDAEGFLFLTGRVKDLVNRGGEKISCLEVETAILEHAAVMDCVVFGLPDERLGEVVACACQIAAGRSLEEAELAAFLAERLAAYKIPQRMRLQRNPLPQLASGKVDRRAMKAAFQGDEA